MSTSAVWYLGSREKWWCGEGGDHLSFHDNFFGKSGTHVSGHHLSHTAILYPSRELIFLLFSKSSIGVLHLPWSVEICKENLGQLKRAPTLFLTRVFLNFNVQGKCLSGCRRCAEAGVWRACGQGVDRAWRECCGVLFRVPRVQLSSTDAHLHTKTRIIETVCDMFQHFPKSFVFFFSKQIIFGPQRLCFFLPLKSRKSIGNLGTHHLNHDSGRVLCKYQYSYW